MALKINENGIDRDMTASEEAEFLAWAIIAQAEAKTISDAKIAKDLARKKILDKLGLSAEEAEALFG